MFVISAAQAAMIRAAYEQRGEFSAAVELRQLCPGIMDNAQARECVRLADAAQAATTGESASRQG
jgi:hypothetical protein